MHLEQIEVTLVTDSPDETEKVGSCVGQHLSGGEVLALEGDLGTGKTTFVRGLAQGLGIPHQEISSPTFVFAHEHHGRIHLAHVDLFRITNGGGLLDLGISDYLNPSWVLAIEWAEKDPEIHLENPLVIRFTETSTNHIRRLSFQTLNQRYNDLIHQLKEHHWVLRNSEAS